MFYLVIIAFFSSLFQVKENKYYMYYYEKKRDLISKKEYDRVTIKDSVKALNDSIGYKKCLEKNEAMRHRRIDAAFRVKTNSKFEIITDYKFTDDHHIDLRKKLHPLTINRILWK